MGLGWVRVRVRVTVRVRVRVRDRVRDRVRVRVRLRVCVPAAPRAWRCRSRQCPRRMGWEG